MPRDFIKPRGPTGKSLYLSLREVGYSRETAARRASISLAYAVNLDNMSATAPCVHMPEPANDEAYVERLVLLGGFPRLSERPTRAGHVACLPLIPFEARP